MKKPLTPPKFDWAKASKAMIEELKMSVKGDSAARKRLERWHSPITAKGEYIHWDNLWHKLQPDNAAVKQQWEMLKLARAGGERTLPLSAAGGKRFWFYPKLDDLEQFKHRLDKRAAGILGAEDPDMLDEKRMRRFLIDRLREEAIHSSILEGAATTRVVAREVLARKNPKPRDHAETMIVNNYYAMRCIEDDIKNKSLSISVILDLHRKLTEGTMKLEETGRLRQSNDVVVAAAQTELHRPPPAAEVEERMRQLCDFANGKIPQEFLHPVIRAIILHFMLAYIHPFADGNGRTARALFYWAMARSGYWMTAYISISEVVRRAPRNYYRAFLFTETDDNDITYFLLHQKEVIEKAFARLDAYLAKETALMRNDKWARDMRGVLNSRQIALLNAADKNPARVFSAYEHQARHNVSYPTARADLLALAEMKILSRHKRGKKYVYEIREDALERLKRKRR